MKRILLEQRTKEKLSGAADTSHEDMPCLSEMVSELRLLKDLPFSYLIGEENLLPPESIRFFYLDENWLDALTDGAMSVGRVAKREAGFDCQMLGLVANSATQNLALPRFKRMHPNHRRRPRCVSITSKVRTGFLLRSELVGKWKGLEAFGYHGEAQLEILRMEALSNEILICIFDGALTKFVISEPKTGLRFGAPYSTGEIVLRDLTDNENFGKPLQDKKISLLSFTEPNGKIRIKELAQEMSSKINETIGSAQFAFELIATAKRAEFHKGGE